MFSCSVVLELEIDSRNPTLVDLIKISNASPEKDYNDGKRLKNPNSTDKRNVKQRTE